MLEELKNKLSTYNHFIWNINEIVKFYDTFLKKKGIYIIFLVHRTRYENPQDKIPEENIDYFKIVDYQPFLNNSLENFLKALICLLEEAACTSLGTALYLNLNPIEEKDFVSASAIALDTPYSVDAQDLIALGSLKIDAFVKNNVTEFIRLIDIDLYEDTTRSEVESQLLNLEAIRDPDVHLISTHGGYHIIHPINKIIDLKNFPLPIDKSDASKIVIPGTIQGGFNVTLLH